MFSTLIFGPVVYELRKEEESMECRLGNHRSGQQRYKFYTWFRSGRGVVVTGEETVVVERGSEDTLGGAIRGT